MFYRVASCLFRSLYYFQLMCLLNTSNYVYANMTMYAMYFKNEEIYIVLKNGLDKIVKYDIAQTVF